MCDQNPLNNGHNCPIPCCWICCMFILQGNGSNGSRGSSRASPQLLQLPSFVANVAALVTGVPLQTMAQAALRLVHHKHNQLVHAAQMQPHTRHCQPVKHRHVLSCKVPVAQPVLKHSSFGTAPGLSTAVHCLLTLQVWGIRPRLAVL